MKRRSLYFLVALFTFTIGNFASFVNSLYLASRQTLTLEIEAATLDLPCPRDAFTVKSQTDASTELVIVSASCNGSNSKAQLTLKNIGTKAIRGYEVGNIQNYEYKKDNESSQGVTSNYGTALAPGATVGLNFGGGFRDGLSY